ncbi:hypothetical protein PTSG_09138 [Salpingoeca rosetta]|uniref:Transmembrane protein n=1 Tax=Salpingoeca rosetta (strain ATCC 50818 / BSB-021) TaxID=946362 RepID=F2UMU4_SALR5|nr:uncharacterized protein PTSG_09138 [Salpingoeca rosetta]EGD78443.1 hypothetical protein PTSG_09138 [Salpingoeca rosetta]|eukprot:XP_004989392.1 hypothetical protein PTSG_09138 [Salpingoeca rosetta]
MVNERLLEQNGEEQEGYCRTCWRNCTRAVFAFWPAALSVLSFGALVAAAYGALTPKDFDVTQPTRGGRYELFEGLLLGAAGAAALAVLLVICNKAKFDKKQSTSTRHTRESDDQGCCCRCGYAWLKPLCCDCAWLPCNIHDDDDDDVESSGSVFETDPMPDDPFEYEEKDKATLLTKVLVTAFTCVKVKTGTHNSLRIANRKLGPSGKYLLVGCLVFMFMGMGCVVVYELQDQVSTAVCLEGYDCFVSNPNRVSHNSEPVNCTEVPFLKAPFYFDCRRLHPFEFSRVSSVLGSAYGALQIILFAINAFVGFLDKQPPKSRRQNEQTGYCAPITSLPWNFDRVFWWMLGATVVGLVSPTVYLAVSFSLDSLNAPGIGTLLQVVFIMAGLVMLPLAFCCSSHRNNVAFVTVKDGVLMEYFGRLSKQVQEQQSLHPEREEVPGKLDSRPPTTKFGGPKATEQSVQRMASHGNDPTTGDDDTASAVTPLEKGKPQVQYGTRLTSHPEQAV